MRTQAQAVDVVDQTLEKSVRSHPGQPSEHREFQLCNLIYFTYVGGRIVVLRVARYRDSDALTTFRSLLFSNDVQAGYLGDNNKKNALIFRSATPSATEITTDWHMKVQTSDEPESGLKCGGRKDKLFSRRD